MGVGEGVSVGVKLAVGVAVAVNVAVGVGVLLGVKLAVKVAVGVSDGAEGVLVEKPVGWGVLVPGSVIWISSGIAAAGMTIKTLAANKAINSGKITRRITLSLPRRPASIRGPLRIGQGTFCPGGL